MEGGSFVMSPGKSGHAGNQTIFKINGISGTTVVDGLVGVHTFPTRQSFDDDDYNPPKTFTLGFPTLHFWKSLLTKADSNDLTNDPLDSLSKEEQDAIRNLTIHHTNWQYQKEESTTIDINETIEDNLETLRQIVSTFGSFVRSLTYIGYKGADEVGVSESNIQAMDEVTKKLLPENCQKVSMLHLKGDYFVGRSSAVSSEFVVFPKLNTLILDSDFQSFEIIKFLSNTNVRELSVCMDELIYTYSSWGLLGKIRTLNIRDLSFECMRLVNTHGGKPSIFSQLTNLNTIILTCVGNASWEETAEFLNKAISQTLSISTIGLDDSFVSMTFNTEQCPHVSGIVDVRLNIPFADQKIHGLMRIFTDLRQLYLYVDDSASSDEFYRNIPWALLPKLEKVVDWPARLVYCPVKINKISESESDVTLY